MWTTMALVSKWIGVLWIWTAANFAPTKELTKERFLCEMQSTHLGVGKGKEKEKRKRPTGENIFNIDLQGYK